MIRAKIYRALSSRLEEEKEKELGIQTFDAQTSAFIAVNGLIAIADALTKLTQHKPLGVLRGRLYHLGKTAIDLTEILDLEFDLNVI